jgi:hypothetical protein
VELFQLDAVSEPDDKVLVLYNLWNFAKLPCVMIQHLSYISNDILLELYLVYLAWNHSPFAPQSHRSPYISRMRCSSASWLCSWTIGDSMKIIIRTSSSGKQKIPTVDNSTIYCCSPYWI